MEVVWAVACYRIHLERTHFTVRINHEAIDWLLEGANDPRKLSRRRRRLTYFNFDILHISDTDHQAPNVLRRLNTGVIEIT